MPLLRLAAGLAATMTFFPAIAAAQFLPGESRSGPVTQRTQYEYMVQGEVGEAMSHWRGALEQGKPSAVAELYSKDALLMIGDSISVHGRASLERVFGEWERVNEVRMEPVGFSASNEVGTEQGLMTIIFDLPDGHTRTVHGNYSVSLRREKDGSWLIAMQLLSMNVPSRGPRVAQ